MFAYGTLREGQFNCPVMESHLARALGEGCIRGELYNLGAFPAVSLDGDGVVVGEWAEVTDNGLAALDRLEGYPEYYDRSIVQDVNSGLEGWVYHMTGRIPAGAPLITGGDLVLSYSHVSTVGLLMSSHGTWPGLY
nr:gamma-glutamylcyclotransferase family protein [Alicyclobacillus contaminans]